MAFIVDELPALTKRTWTLTALDAAPETSFSTRRDGNWMELSNGTISLRLPATRDGVDEFPGPIDGVQLVDGPWLGGSRLELSDWLEPAAIESECLSEGPLWLTWQVRYCCKSGADYRLTVTLYADETSIEITEASTLCRDAHWELSLRRGLAPNCFRTHPLNHKAAASGRCLDLDPAEASRRPCLGAITLPAINRNFEDDYECAVFLGEAETALTVTGIHGGTWDYPYANALDIYRSAAGDVWLQGAVKAGHRHWLLTLEEAAPYRDPDDFFATPAHRRLMHYETPLDKVKDYVLDWDPAPATDRPFMVANREQLAAVHDKIRAHECFREYLDHCDPALPGDFTYYSAATHRPFTEEPWNDPAVRYVAAADAEARRRQARHLADMLLAGLQSRRDAFLKLKGHRDREAGVLNVGRAMRPWAALYDFAAAEDVFSPAEDRLVRASFAFLCYKATDPDYWAAEAIVRRDDHPGSAHRQAWFPNRHSDWALYNIDNVPHNFHNDVWTAVGCAALALPNHPRSREWIRWTLDWWEEELTWWVLPEGAWLESTTYTLGTIRDYVIYCRALSNARIRDYFTDERLQRVFRWLTEMLLPYDRRLGQRGLPVMGDGHYPNNCFLFGWMAGLSGHDPEFARQLQWAWKETGADFNEPGRFGLNFFDFLFLNPDQGSEEPPAAESRCYHGLGAVLRHAPRTPEEIFLFIKAGLVYSHFHEPEGTFQIWWHGLPLCDEYGVQYGVSTSEERNHNCIEVKAGFPCVYNKGDIGTFVATDAFDYVVVEAPIQQLYLQPGQSPWGYQGEAGPAGWHRRHFFFVKPRYLFVYDELICPHPTEYHLNVKADSLDVAGNRVVFSGTYDTDLTVLFPDLGERRIETGSFGVPAANRPGHQSPGIPDEFYDQLQLHVANAPQQDLASLLVPSPAAGERPTVEVAGRGCRIRMSDADETAWLFPAPTEIEQDGRCFAGLAGACRDDGRLTLCLAKGHRIGVNGRLQVDGDGPFTAVLEPDGRVTIAADGVGRWLTVTGPALASARLDGTATALENSGGGIRVYVPAGIHTMELLP